MFIGYPFGKKGWELYDLESKEIFVSRDVIFYEDIFPFILANKNALQGQGSVEQHIRLESENTTFVSSPHELGLVNNKTTQLFDLELANTSTSASG